MKHKHTFIHLCSFGVISFLTCAGISATLNKSSIANASTAINFSQNIGTNGLGNSLQKFGTAGDEYGSGSSTAGYVKMTNTNYLDGWLYSKEDVSITNGNSYVIQYHQQSDSCGGAEAAPYPYKCFTPLATTESAAWGNMLMYYNTGNFITVNAKTTSLGAWDNFNGYINDCMYRWVFNPNGSVNLYVCQGSDEANLVPFPAAVQAQNFFGVANVFNYTTTGKVMFMGNGYKGSVIYDHIKIGQATSATAAPTWSIDSGERPGDYFMAGNCTSATVQIVDGVASQTQVKNPTTKAGALYSKGTVSVASNISLTLTPKTSTAGKIYGITIGNDFSSPFNGVLCGIGNDSSSNGYLYIYNLSTGSKLKEVSLGTNIVGSQGTLTVSYTAAGAITASYGGKSLTTTIASVVDKYVGIAGFDYQSGGSFVADLGTLSITGTQNTVKNGRSFDEKFLLGNDLSMFDLYYTNGFTYNCSTSGFRITNATTGSNLFTKGEYSDFDATIKFNLNGSGWLGVVFAATTKTAGPLFTGNYTFPFVNISANGLEVWNHNTIGKENTYGKSDCAGLASQSGTLYVSTNNGTVTYSIKVGDGSKVQLAQLSNVSTDGYFAFTTTEGCNYTIREFAIENKTITSKAPTDTTVGKNMSVSLGETSSLKITGTSNYSDSLAFTYTKDNSDNVALAAQGTIELNVSTGLFSFTAKGGATKGTYKFNYIIDDHGLTISGVINITISTTDIIRLEANTSKVKVNYLRNEFFSTEHLTVRAVTSDSPYSFKALMPDAYTVTNEGLSVPGDFTAIISLNVDPSVYTTYIYHVFDVLPSENPLPPEIDTMSFTYKKGCETPLEINKTNAGLDLKGEEIVSITKDDNTVLTGEEYGVDVANNSLVFVDTYLDGLEVGLHAFELITRGGRIAFTIEITPADIVIEKGNPIFSSTSYSFNVNDENDLTMAVEFNGGVFSALKLDGEDITGGEGTNFSITDSAVILFNSYLTSEAFEVGNTYSVSLLTDVGEAIVTLNIIDNGESHLGPTFYTPYVTFDKGSYDDVVVKVNLNDCTFQNLAYEGEILSTDYYSFSGDTLTISGLFLSALTYGNHKFTLMTEYGNAQLIVAINERQYNDPQIIGDPVISYKKGSGQVRISVDLKSAPFQYLIYDGAILSEGVDSDYYFDEGDTVLYINGSFVDNLECGNQSFTLITSGGSVDFVVNVIQQYEVPVIEESIFTRTVNDNEDILINVETGNCGIASICVDFADSTYTLVAGSDYYFAGSQLLIKASYLLDKLDNVGQYTHTITTLGGEVKFVINTLNGDEPVVVHEAPVVLSDSYVDFVVGSGESISFEFDLKGEELEYILYGDVVLEMGVDYEYDEEGEVVSFSSSFFTNKTEKCVFTLVTEGGYCQFVVGIVEEQVVIANGCVTSVGAVSSIFALLTLSCLTALVIRKRKKED